MRYRTTSIILFAAIFSLILGNGFNPTFADDDDNNQIIKNGSFEVPEVDKGEWELFTESNQLKWDIDFIGNNCPSSEPTLEIQHKVPGLGKARDKKQHAELDGECSTSISQEIQTKLHEKYVLEFYSKKRPHTSDQTNGLRVLIDDDPVITITDMSNNWKKSKFEFMGTGEKVRITFEDIGESDSFGTFIDKIQVKSKKIDDDDKIKWIIKLLMKIMTGEIEWVHWDSIKHDTIPKEISDGDNDTLAELGLSCSDGQIAQFNAINQVWECVDNEGGGISEQSCDPGEVVTGFDQDGNALCDPSFVQTLPSGAISSQTGWAFNSTVIYDCDDTSGCIPRNVIAEDAIDSSRIEDLSIQNDDLGQNSITSDKIADGEIQTDDIADESITSDKIAPGSISLNVEIVEISKDFEEPIIPFQSEFIDGSCPAGSVITGFNVGVTTFEAGAALAIAETPSFVDPSTILVEVINTGNGTDFDEEGELTDGPTISSVNLILFCSSITP